MKKLLVLMLIGFVLVGCGNVDIANTEVDNQNVTDVENTELEEVTTESETIENVTEAEEETETEPEEVVEEVKYSYTDMDKTMYAKQSVNVRDLPSTEGNKLGGLSYAQEVHVTGQCTETLWYRIEFDGTIAYVSNSYLVDEKPQEQVVATQTTVTVDTPTPSGVPGDTDGDGIRSPEEESEYISPIEQACINAGYGNVVQIDATTYAVLTPDFLYYGMPAGMYLDNYLKSIGIMSGKQNGGWIDRDKGYYHIVGFECYSIQ